MDPIRFQSRLRRVEKMLGGDGRSYDVESLEDVLPAAQARDEKEERRKATFSPELHRFVTDLTDDEAP